MENVIRVLFLGDIVGPLGRIGVKKYLALHKEADNIDFVIANGENTTHGHGLSYEHYKELLSYGVDCLTSGNHFFNTPDCFNHAKDMVAAIRPYNLDKGAPGVGSKVFMLKDGTKIRVSNVLGRVYLTMTQGNPFYALDEIIKEDNGESLIHIVDMHAEATAEKRCIAEYVDGKVTAVLGTHTHVQTNDAKCLNKGTFFLTDAGMNGAYDSSLGDEKAPSIYRTMTGMPTTLSVPRTGKVLINGVRMDIDRNTGKVVEYLLINETAEGTL